MLLSTNPWTYLRDIKIDMGYAAATGSDIFLLLRLAVALMSVLLIMGSIIAYIVTQKAQEKSVHKENGLKRTEVLFMVGASIFILSLIMVILNYFFGV